MSLNPKKLNVIEKVYTITGDPEKIKLLRNILNDVERKLHYSTVQEPLSGSHVIPEEYIDKFLDYRRVDQGLKTMINNLGVPKSTTEIVNLGSRRIEYDPNEIPNYINEMNNHLTMLRNFFRSNYNIFNSKELYKYGLSPKPADEFDRVVNVENLDLHEITGNPLVDKGKAKPRIYVKGKAYNKGALIYIRLKDGSYVDFDKKLKVNKKVVKLLEKMLQQTYNISKIGKIETIGDLARLYALIAAQKTQMRDIVAGKPKIAIFKDNNGNDHSYAIVPVYGNSNTKILDFEPLQPTNIDVANVALGLGII